MRCELVVTVGGLSSQGQEKPNGGAGPGSERDSRHPSKKYTCRGRSLVLGIHSAGAVRPDQEGRMTTMRPFGFRVGW